jgi:predicted dehydrogenase
LSLRWGLIGCGDIARRNVAPALVDLANCELLAINRARPDQAEAFAREFGASRYYARWQDLLADQEVDAVYLATPVYLHAAQAIAAADAGKHVLCEKPMAMKVAECDAMIAACLANRVTLGVAYYRHFYPLIKRIKEILTSGEIGQSVIAQINAFEWFNPPPDHPRYWLTEKQKSGGGPMFDFGCHRIEVLMHLFGVIDDTRSLIGNTLFDREIEDTALAILRMASGTNATLTVTHAAYEGQDTLQIFGSLGSIHVPALNVGEMTIRTGNGERRESHPRATNVHRPLIEDFVEAVLQARQPQVSGEIAREVARIEEAIYESSSRRVSLA